MAGAIQMLLFIIYLLFLWQTWRSHHSIAISENHMLHANAVTLCFVEPKLLPIEVLHCGNMYFGPFKFASVTLTLTRWPSYTKLTRIPWRYTGYVKINFLRQCFRKLSYYSPLMRAFCYAWSLPVTWQRSRHTVDLPYSKTPCTWLYFYRTGIIADQRFTLREWGFRFFFVPVTLTLTRWPSYTKMTRIPWRYTRCASMDFLRQGFWKLSSDRRTYLHSLHNRLHIDRYDRNYMYHATSRVVD